MFKDIQILPIVFIEYYDRLEGHLHKINVIDSIEYPLECVVCIL